MATPRAAEHRDLEEKFKRLERKVRELTTATLTRKSASVGAGSSLVVSGGGAVEVRDAGEFRVKRPDNAGNAVVFGRINFGDGTTKGTGMQAVDETGGLVLYAGSDPTGSGRFAVVSEGGHFLFSDDGGSGYGIAVPYLHFGLFPAPSASAVTTTSTTFTSLHAGRIQYVGPYLRVIVVAVLGSGVTQGALQLTLDGAVVGTQTFTATGELTFEVPLYDKGKTPTTTGALLVQGRVVTGSGTVGAIPRACHCRQS